tara:strand:+ start:13297 stop:14478 length:1182 start_codon:yes stop_codon:yes gene_type:complete
MSDVPMFTPLRDYNQNKEKYQTAINTVLEHGRFINGPEIGELEEKLANYIKVKHCIAVSSGTDALLVALMALNVKPGDSVITVAHTWISTAEVISVLGAKPIFVDINPDNFCLNMDLVQELMIKKREKGEKLPVGIIYVSLYGQSEDPEKICKIARDNNLWVIEDGAQSFGSVHTNTKTGKKTPSCSWGDVGCTSFFPSKPLGGYGDSGACFTNNDEMASKLRAIKNHGGARRFCHTYVGLNARMDTIQAAVLLVKFGTFVEGGGLNARRKIANIYDEQLNEIKGLTLPHKVEGVEHAWAQYSMLVSDELMQQKGYTNRDAIVEKLKESGIQVSVFYPKGLHLQEAFKDNMEIYKDLGTTEYVCDHVLNLPLFPELTDQELNKIVNTIKSIFQ